MLSTASRLRLLSRATSFVPRATFTSSSRLSTGENRIQANDPKPKTPTPNVSKTNETPSDSLGNIAEPFSEGVVEAEEMRVTQAPNRSRGIWSRSQAPRSDAMAGPRFEQTIMEVQPQPYAAIELIHQQPVRWTHDRVVSCDGGGGPMGHPRVFINTDKPQICMCEYCGLPFANEHHRAHLESLPHTSYPLKPTGNAAEVNEAQRVTDEAYGHR